MCLISSSVIGLQRLLDLVADYCREHSIIINVLKTNCIYFCNAKNTSLLPLGTDKINGSQVNITDTFKYLGHILHCHMDDTSDIKAQLRLFFDGGTRFCESLVTVLMM